MFALKVQKLTKSFKTNLLQNPKIVLDQISFTISPGMSMGFLGANGSGKTSTLKCLLGLMPYDSGEVSFFNHFSLSKTVLKKVGFLQEKPYFYDYLTAEELLLFYGKLSTNLKTIDLKKSAHTLLKELDIYHVKDQKLKTYSKGMIQKVGVAQALIHNPDLVILDEPLSGLDPDSRLCVGDLIQERIQQGLTVFFSSHLLYDVEKLCSHLVILKGGKIIYEDSVKELLNRIQNRRKIVFLQNHKKHIIFVDGLQECQNKIDQLRKTSCIILDIQMDKQNLEQAYRTVL